MKVGVLGGGQLARMLALAGYPLGLRFVVLDPSEHACATHLCAAIQADYHDQQALQQLAQQVDVVTFEFENVPADSVRYLQEHAPAFPPAQALAVAQDRLNEKNMFSKLGIAVPEFRAVDSLQDLQKAAQQLDYPFILKTRSMGYDGKGQQMLNTELDIPLAWQALGGSPLIAERKVNFDREVSIIAARNRSGAVVFYPLSENHHENGILRYAISRPDDPMQQLAEQAISRVLDELDYVGVLALELFEVDGALLANEIAPRVHNSGHWSIEGSGTSQFENHLRAILDLPLGSTAPVGYSAMVNFIGTMPTREVLLSMPNVHLHDYQKSPRPGRKIGHATVRADSPELLKSMLNQLLQLAPRG